MLYKDNVRTEGTPNTKHKYTQTLLSVVDQESIKLELLNLSEGSCPEVALWSHMYHELSMLACRISSTYGEIYVVLSYEVTSSQNDRRATVVASTFYIGSTILHHYTVNTGYRS